MVVKRELRAQIESLDCFAAETSGHCQWTTIGSDYLTRTLHLHGEH